MATWVSVGLLVLSLILFIETFQNASLDSILRHPYLVTQEVS